MSVHTRSNRLTRTLPILLAAAAGSVSIASADPIPLNPAASSTPTTSWLGLPSGPITASAAWELAGGWLDQAPLGGGRTASTSGDFAPRGGPGTGPGTGSSSLTRWPGLTFGGPMVLGTVGLEKSAGGADRVVAERHGSDQPRSYLPIPSDAGGFGDPGFTPPPVVPLPAAAWAGLSVLPLIGAGRWARRRRLVRG